MATTLDHRYLQARSEAIAADASQDWAQLVGPETSQSPTAAPKAPATPTPEATQPSGETGVDVIASIGAPEPEQTGNPVLTGIKGAVSSIASAVGAALNPTAAERVMRHFGLKTMGTLGEVEEGLRESGVPEKYMLDPTIRDAIEGYLSAIHTMSFKGKTMPPEAPAAKELLAGAVEPGATPRINMERIAASDKTKAVIERINQMNVESGATEQAVRGVVGHEETKAVAQQLITSGTLTVDRLLEMPAGTFLPGVVPEAQALAAINIRVTSETHLRQLAEAVVKGDSQAADLLYDALAVNGAIDLKVTAMSTSAGRTLDIHNVMAEAEAGRFDPASLREIAERLRLGGATPGQGAQAAIPPSPIDPTILAQMILQTQTLAGARGVRTFTRGVIQAKGITFTDMLYEAWMSGLLSNPETHGRNLANGLLQAVFGIPIRAMARTMSRDPDGVVSGEAAGMVYAIVAAFDEGLKIGWQSLRTGIPQFGGHQQAPYQRAISGVGLESASRGYLSAGGTVGRAFDLLGHITGSPTRLLMSAGEFLKQFNYRLELQALGVRDGVQQGKTGAALAAHVADTVANPPSVVHEMAKKYAAYNNYTDEYGRIGQALNTVRERVWGGRWIMPFMRVATNISKMAFEMTPLQLLLKATQEDILAGGARRDLAVAKVAMGSLMMGSAAAMAAGGQITGSGPVNPELNAAWRRTHQPHSFKFPGSDTWISGKWMGPLWMPFGVAATMVEMGEGLPEAGWDQIAMASALATAEMFLDFTWSKGLMDVTQAIREPETKGMDYLRTFATSFVPGLVGEFEKLLDPGASLTKPPPAWFGYYDTRGIHQWEAVDALLARWAARVPGFSSLLPPARDVWGQARSQSFGLKEEGDDPVDRELLRLRLPIAMPASTIAGASEPTSVYADQERPNVGVPLSNVEYDEYVRLAGNELKLPNDLAGGTYGLHDALAKVMASPHYKTLTDDRDGGKAFEIGRMVQMYREAARLKLLERHPELKRLVAQRQEERVKARVGDPSASTGQRWQELLGIQR